MRISRHQMLMEMARTASKRSTCHRLNVGAIISVDGRPISVGYNGPPSGEHHCQGNSCNLSSSGGCVRSDHAEYNAIKFMDKHYTTLKYADIYCTHSPCPNCAKLIIDSCIRKVYYEIAYRDTSAIEILIAHDIEVFRYSPSGYLFNHASNRVEEA